MSFNITERFLDFALLGAEWVMWLLVVLSIVSVYVMIERALFYSGVARGDRETRRRVMSSLGDSAYDEVVKLTKGSNGSAARIVSEMATQAARGRASVEAAMTGARAEEKIRLERNLSFLGTLGANAPFIGLFGTVLGIIQAFHELAKSGINPGGEQSTAVMAGISEALVATAVGLLVAIPAVVAYNIFQRRVKRTLANADALSSAAFALIVQGDSDGEED